MSSPDSPGTLSHHAGPSRAGFSSSLGVLAATLGSAVGLGNIWKFPSLTGANGGAGFLLVYLLSTLLIGLPLMVAEIAIGRQARANPISALRQLAPRGAPWWLVGLGGMAAAFLILSFYSEVVAWVFAYVAKALAGSLLSADPAQTQASFDALVTDPVQSLLWQWVVLAFIGSILLLGVTKGIEAVTKKLMPLLFLLLLLLCGYSLTLPGAGLALSFLFAPEWHKITPAVVLTAMGLAFFKLSIGMGTMMTYGSYFTPGQNIPATATRVMLADLSVSLLAGMAIFPAVFSFGFAPSAGPSLVFITIPAVFAQIPGGQVLLDKGFYNITGLAWSGRGKVKRVDVSVDGGRNWRTARLETPVLDKCLTRFNLDWVWDGKPTIVQSRAMDETGYVQPSYKQLREVRGTRSIYHNNAIQSWLVQENGEVKNVQIA